jgi:hypothetical protein
MTPRRLEPIGGSALSARWLTGMPSEIQVLGSGREIDLAHPARVMANMAVVGTRQTTSTQRRRSHMTHARRVNSNSSGKWMRLTQRKESWYRFCKVSEMSRCPGTHGMWIESAHPIP